MTQPVRTPAPPSAHPLADPLSLPLAFKQWVVDYVTQELQLGKVVGFQANPVVVTGIIPATGTTPTAGTGFTYTHANGSGIYVFTFTIAFAATPTIVATFGPAAAVGREATLTVEASTGFTVTCVNTATGVATDVPFNFVAHTTV